MGVIYKYIIVENINLPYNIQLFKIVKMFGIIRNNTIQYYMI